MPLAAVLILGVVLVGILIAVLVLVLGVILILVVILVLILVLVIHSLFLQICNQRACRIHSLPNLSGFILCFKYKTCHKPSKDGRGDSAGCCFQPPGEDA